MPLRILLYGEDWEGTHVDSISKVLSNKNIIFEKFDFYPFIYIDTVSKIINGIYRRVFLKINENILNKNLITKIDKFKPNVFIISKGLNIYPETLHYAKKRSVLIINWNPDDFFNKKNTSNHLINSLSIYDLVFSARPHLFDEYKAKGIRNPLYLEWYYLPWLHKKPNEILSIQNKITFVGTFSTHRESIVRKIVNRIPIEIWGSQWENSKVLMNDNVTIHKKILSQSMFPEIMSQSLINLNILTKENRDVTNLKIFEIPASYGLMLTDYTQTTHAYLNDNAFYFDSFNPESINLEIDNILSRYTKSDLYDLRHESYLNIISNNNDIESRVNSIISTLQSQL